MTSSFKKRYFLHVSALVELKSELETTGMRKQNFLKHILGKDRISTILLDRKDDLQASFNALQVSDGTLTLYDVH